MSVVLFAPPWLPSALEAVILLRPQGRPGPADARGRVPLRDVGTLTPVILFLVSIPIAFWNPTVALLSWLLSIPLGIILAAPSGRRAQLVVDPGVQDAD